MLLAMALPSILLAPMAGADAENDLLVWPSKNLLCGFCRRGGLGPAVWLEPVVLLTNNRVLVENLE